MENIQQLKTPEFLTAFAESRIGGRMENQDSYGADETPFGYLITVCDGMGGGPGGKTASSIAVREIILGVKEGGTDDTLRNILIKAVRRANLAIIEQSLEIPELSGMGSTCTVVLINKHSALIAHVGDSRVYQIRGKSKVFRTFDHSMVFDLVRQKVITEEQARLSAQSNVITRALGLKTDLEVEIAEVPYLAGDRFLLSTDGIHGSLPEAELIAAVSDRKHSLGAVTDTIATLVDGQGREEGGHHDNLTLAIVETNINSILKVKMDKRTKILVAALAALCLVSLCFNCLQLKHKPTLGEVMVETVADSLKSMQKQLEEKDSALRATRDSIRENDAKIKELEAAVKKLEQERKNKKNR